MQKITVTYLFLPSSQEKLKQERASARKIAEFHLVHTLGTRRVSRFSILHFLTITALLDQP